MANQFKDFIECLNSSVPHELQRNFNLLKDLDSKTEEIMLRINECTKEYKTTPKRSERSAIRNKSNELFDKLESICEDKIQLSLQTYELIDRSIKRLLSLGKAPQAEESADMVVEAPLIGFDMPLDPNEPKYCICQSVSYGDMIACDNKECPIEWFHYACVGLHQAPKGKWYCGQCNNNTNVKRPKSRSRRQRR